MARRRSSSPTIRSHVDYAKFLLELGADPKKGPGFTPLHWVVGDWSVELAGDKTAIRPEGTEWDRLLPLAGTGEDGLHRSCCSNTAPT